MLKSKTLIDNNSIFFFSLKKRNKKSHRLKILIERDSAKLIFLQISKFYDAAFIC